MRIAFIGLGAMGLPMARQIALAGNAQLTLFDVRQEQLERAQGLGRLASSLPDAVAGADAVFSVVPADRQVAAVVDEMLPVTHPGQVYVDFSTIGPRTMQHAADRLAGAGVITVGAGMTQSIDGATTGTLVLFMGGPDELPSVIGPAIGAMASEVRMVGSVGAAKSLKLINNMLNASINIAVSEALVLGRQVGLTYEETAFALRDHGADSWPLQNHTIKHVLPNDLGPGFFSTNYLMKDLKLGIGMLTELGLPAPFAGLALSYLRGSAAHGHGDDYHMIVVRWLEQGANASGGAGPMTSAWRGDQRQAEVTLVRAVAALQTLYSLDAVNVLHHLDVAPLDVARHFEAGSAGNDSLRALQRHLEGAAAVQTPSGLLDDFERVLELASDTETPGTAFELGRQVTLGLSERFGRDVNLWDLPQLAAPGRRG
ncbi:MAG TPA: NAD(P)-dependent oxidoreductase [Trebonia sp.]|jgi:3-hydroxyisobutyrate dehydrogenase|nr:NAD(P)-dependent oxidoreductase [Trebonia sp.]